MNSHNCSIKAKTLEIHQPHIFHCVDKFFFPHINEKNSPFMLKIIKVK